MIHFVTMTAVLDVDDPDGEPARAIRFNIAHIVGYGPIESTAHREGFHSEVLTDDLTWYAREMPEEIDELIAAQASAR